jgi:hypothetical protein
VKEKTQVKLASLIAREVSLLVRGVAVDKYESLNLRGFFKEHLEPNYSLTFSI